MDWWGWLLAVADGRFQERAKTMTEGVCDEAMRKLLGL